MAGTQHAARSILCLLILVALASAMACAQTGTSTQGGNDNAGPATGSAQSPIVYCPDFTVELAFKEAPFTSIGYLNNGCTATLIDPWHILAAAHCFVWDNVGEWQTGLNFYPQFDPSNANPRRYTVDRAVVGTRVLTGSGYFPSDWGIGHLRCNGAFCPPAPEPALPILPTWLIESFVFAGYPRDSHPTPPPNSVKECTVDGRPEHIVSLTASRWQDNSIFRTVVPVVFATDDQGNVYYTEQLSNCSPATPCCQDKVECDTAAAPCYTSPTWLAWRSFYQ